MFRLCAWTVALATFLSVSAANSSTLQLDGYTAPVQSVHFGASPVPGTPTWAGATGFQLTDISDAMGSFTAWCLDVGHYLMSIGETQEYSATNTPYSNSYGLSAIAETRVQSVFDANYGSLDISNGDQAAAFQLALWEAAFEADLGALSLTGGLFQASSTGSTALANTFLDNATSYSGDRVWDLTFLEVDGFGPDRSSWTGQNLVTASVVPVPAAGLLLLSGVFGIFISGRRRKRS